MLAMKRRFAKHSAATQSRHRIRSHYVYDAQSELFWSCEETADAAVRKLSWYMTQPRYRESQLVGIERGFRVRGIPRN